jgi:hypothetical protein
VPKLVVGSVIRGNGEVAKVELTPAELNGSPVGACIRQAASKVRYPPHDQVAVTFRQPLRLKINK